MTTSGIMKPPDTRHNPNKKVKMKTLQVSIVEVNADIRTRTGNATLYKGWSEANSTIISIWSNDDTPNPFLQGAEVGDTIRVVAETRSDTDLDGKVQERTYYTVIPTITAK